MLIGLTGCKGAGKDTAASFLEDYHVMKFAGPLKSAVAALFDLKSVDDVDALKEYMAWIEIRHPLSSEAINMSWRTFLQRFGTEMGRKTFGADFWVDQWEIAYTQLSVLDPDAFRHVAVTDTRFVNEALRIKNSGGYIIEIRRPGHEPDGHASEEPLPDDLVDATVLNDSDLETLRSRVIATVEGLKVGIVS